MNTILQTTKQIGFLTIALTLALLANFAYGQWANPTAAPTGDNVAAPINTASTTQTKPGLIGAFEFVATSKMRSNQYCDEAGNNCVSAAGGFGAGGSGWQSIDLTGTDLFDEACEYRMQTSSVLPTIISSPAWLYMTGVTERDIVYIAHYGLISHIRHNSKNVYRVNNAAHSITVFDIQKRCGSSALTTTGGNVTSVTFTGTDCSGWTCTSTSILGQTNVSSVERRETGLYRVYFTTPMSNTNYTVVVNYNMRGGVGNPNRLATVHGSANVFRKEQEYVEVAVGHNHQGGGVSDAVGHLDLVVIGR